ncbi:hypothetical protein [Massilia varians]|uniref:hypothetical protein n=1 Tax=Massilia varians TaxID=457921 RepID=UPI002553CFB3|nr:hypothetical protein [Massilia varians]MDK6076950.1 hypothetical protein [Massilia varians]
MTRSVAWICLLFTPFACVAQVSDADFCRSGGFPREQDSLGLGVIQGQKNERVHFFEDDDGCPSKGAACRRSAYLVPGDEVLVGKRTADVACVWFQGRKHESVGWVPADKVVPLPVAPLDPRRDWLGTWSDGAGTIRILPAPGFGRTQIASKLRWDGGTAPNGEPRANFGGMHGVLEVQGNRATAAQGSCQVALTRIGRYLVADDNGDCGGINVRHTGVYVRLSAGK